MSDEKMCGCICLYCQAGYPYVCVREDIERSLKFEKENKALKAEVETIRKDNEELSDIYCQRNLILSEENQKLNREIKRLTDWNISLNKRFVEAENICVFSENELEKQKEESTLKLGDLVSVEYRITKEIHGGWCIETSHAERMNIKDLSEVRFHEKKIIGEIVGGGAGLAEDFFWIRFGTRSEGKAHIQKISAGGVDKYVEPKPCPPSPDQGLKIGGKVKVEFEGSLRKITNEACVVDFVNYSDGDLESVVLLKKYVKKTEG